MREPKLIKTISEVPVTEIQEVNRLRPTSDAGVQSLMDSITALGVMKDPIQVRKVKHKKGALILIAGAHRLEAARRLGWEKIPAKVWDCADDWARMMEIDDNLTGAEMDTLDLCVFLAERKTIYERLNPLAKRGGARGNQHTGGCQTDVMSFCQNVAEQRDLSERQIRRLVAAGEALDTKAVALLRAAPKKVQLTDLMEISKCDPEQRASVVEALHQGTAKTAKAALAAIGDPTPPRSDQDEKYLKLIDAWGRAPSAARKAFVDARYSEIAVHYEVEA
ncbi:MAG: ParB N-terminal domain-containing protein [Pseudomonadota bacterium]